MNNQTLKSIAIGLAVTLSTAIAGHAQAPLRLTSLFDTFYNTPDLFWLGTDQHVHLSYYNGNWQTTDATLAAGALAAVPESALTSLYDPINRTPDVFYVDTNQHVRILGFTGLWGTTDMTTDAGAPA